MWGILGRNRVGRGMGRVGMLGLLLTAALAGCGSDGEPGPEPGTGTEDDADEQTGAPEPHEILAPSTYDCSAAGPIEPPDRPHALTCFGDPECTSRLVVGHRMATPFAPENSLSALRASILLGTDIVETDIRVTADDQVVFIHDGEVDRTLDGEGDVSSFTLAELRAMPVRMPSKLAILDEPGDFGCETIPTLDDVFEIAAGRIVVELEVKASRAGVIAAEYLRDNDLYGNAFLLCDRGECEAARAAVRDVPIMTRPNEAEEVARELEYDPPPVIVHLDPTAPFLAGEILDSVHAVGAKTFANAFIAADLAAVASGDLSGYTKMYDDGLDVIQTEFPHWALMSLGRLPR